MTVLYVPNSLDSGTHHHPLELDLEIDETFVARLLDSWAILLLDDHLRLTESGKICTRGLTKPGELVPGKARLVN